MKISYEPLFKMMENKGVNKYWLRLNGIHPKTVNAIKNGGVITTTTIVRLCELLDCQPYDVIKVID